MNKIVKVIIVTIAALVGLGAVTAGVIFIFFPGLPTYIECKKEFPKLEEPMENFSEYSVKLSGETQLHNDGTFSVLVPAEWSYKELPYNEDVGAYGGRYRSSNKSDSFLILSSEIPYEEFLSSDFDDIFFTQSDYKSYIKSLGYDVPKSNMELMSIIDSLTWDDFNINSKSDAQVFKALATVKMTPPPTGGEAIYYETAEVSGYIIIDSNEEDLFSLGAYTANLYSVEDPLQNITIVGDASDINTFYGIVNSVKGN